MDGLLSQLKQFKFSPQNSSALYNSIVLPAEYSFEQPPNTLYDPFYKMGLEMYNQSLDNIKGIQKIQAIINQCSTVLFNSDQYKYYNTAQINLVKQFQNGEYNQFTLDEYVHCANELIDIIQQQPQDTKIYLNPLSKILSNETVKYQNIYNKQHHTVVNIIKQPVTQYVQGADQVATFTIQFTGARQEIWYSNNSTSGRDKIGEGNTLSTKYSDYNAFPIHIYCELEPDDDSGTYVRSDVVGLILSDKLQFSQNLSTITYFVDNDSVDLYVVVGQKDTQLGSLLYKWVCNGKVVGQNQTLRIENPQNGDICYCIVQDQNNANNAIQSVSTTLTHIQSIHIAKNLPMQASHSSFTLELVVIGSGLDFKWVATPSISTRVVTNILPDQSYHSVCYVTGADDGDSVKAVISSKYQEFGIEPVTSIVCQVDGVPDDEKNKKITTINIIYYIIFAVVLLLLIVFVLVYRAISHRK